MTQTQNTTRVHYQQLQPEERMCQVLLGSSKLSLN